MAENPKPRVELDKALEEYLDQWSEDKKKGFTNAHIHAQLHQLVTGHREHTRRLEDLEESSSLGEERIEQAHDRLDGHRSAIVHLKRAQRRAKSMNVPDDGHEFDEEMDTGKFDVAAIEREVKDLRSKRMNSERVKAEEATWWKRNIISLILGGVGVAVAALFSALITLAIAGAKQQAQQPPAIIQPLK